MVRAIASITLAAFTIVTLAGAPVQAQPDRASLIITVQVKGQSNVAPVVLFGARANVTRLYRDAGVELQWVTRNPEIVIVLGDEQQAWSLGATSHAMGQAIVNNTSRVGRAAVVYHDRVEDLAMRAGIAPADILGYVMAHEIAHLLGVDHAKTGLMRAGWNEVDLVLASRGLLSFSPAQHEVLRNGVATLSAVAAHAEPTSRR